LEMASRLPVEVGGDGVVGDVGHHPHLLAVLDLPERVAAELAVVALLVDRIAAAAVDEQAVLRVGDDLLALGAVSSPGSTWTLGIRRNGSCARRWRTCTRGSPSRP